MPVGPFVTDFLKNVSPDKGYTFKYHMKIYLEKGGGVQYPFACGLAIKSWILRIEMVLDKSSQQKECTHSCLPTSEEGMDMPTQEAHRTLFPIQS